jgi:hypothetical protein
MKSKLSQRNSRGASMAAATRLLRRLSRTTQSNVRVKTHTHVIVKTHDGTRVSISYQWLSEWLADVRQMAISTRNSSLQYLLQQFPASIDEWDPDDIHVRLEPIQH